MDALEVFQRHQTIRHYRTEPLAEGDLDRIIAAGRRAPTDAKGHMFAFVRITDADLRREISQLANDQQQIRDCAEFFVACVDNRRLQLLIEHRGSSYGMRARIGLVYGTVDTTLVAQNMATAAEALGYGTCYIGAIQNNLDAIARILELPRLVLPVFGLCIGVIDDDRLPPSQPRIPQSLTFMENSYSDPVPEQLGEALEAMSPRRDWFPTLMRYFGAGGTMEQREEVMARAWVQQGFEVTETD